MMIFLDTTVFGGINTLRQTPFFSGALNDSYLSPIYSTIYDYYYISRPSPKFSWIRKCQRIWVMMENPTVWMPSIEFLEWYGYVVSPFKLPSGDYVHIQAHPAVPWFYGVKFKTDQGLLHVPDNNDCQDYNQLIHARPQKKKLISMISSSKQMTAGHKWRIALAEKLKVILGDQIDIFGFGHRPIANKREALDPYLYTVVVENCCHYDYWTEKLSDAMLAGCIPIYFGAPNVSEYFDTELLQVHQTEDVDKSAENVVRLLGSSYSDNDLKRMKDFILNKHNLYAHLPAVLQ
jgi:hypothetical protein